MKDRADPTGSLTRSSPQMRALTLVNILAGLKGRQEGREATCGFV
jgi:hypothetical protein